MGWKYIMFENTIGDLKLLFPVIFPDKMVHSEVAAVLRHCQPGWHKGGVIPVSAGSIGILEVENSCYGESETLKLKSLGKKDADIINNFNYCHGIV